MSERSKLISKLINNRKTREAYVRSKLNVLVPAQIRGLRLRRELTQSRLGEEAEMKQARISAMERPGEVNFNLDTLVRLAAAFGVGMVVKFVPFSEMLSWENEFSQDGFDVVQIDNDEAFICPNMFHPDIRTETLPQHYRVDIAAIETSQQPFTTFATMASEIPYAFRALPTPTYTTYTS